MFFSDLLLHEKLRSQCTYERSEKNESIQKFGNFYQPAFFKLIIMICVSRPKILIVVDASSHGSPDPGNQNVADLIFMHCFY